MISLVLLYVAYGNWVGTMAVVLVMLLGRVGDEDIAVCGPGSLCVVIGSVAHIQIWRLIHVAIFPGCLVVVWESSRAKALRFDVDSGDARGCPLSS